MLTLPEAARTVAFPAALAAATVDFFFESVPID